MHTRSISVFRCPQSHPKPETTGTAPGYKDADAEETTPPEQEQQAEQEAAAEQDGLSEDKLIEDSSAGETEDVDDEHSSAVLMEQAEILPKLSTLNKAEASAAEAAEKVSVRYLVSRINEERDKKGGAERIQSDSVLSHCMLSDAERIKTVEEVLYTITPENKVNVLISDGELLYAHTNYRDSLHMLADRSGVIISTKPLDGGDWRELPLNTLLVFRNHEQIYQGAPHENEFFDSEEKMRFLFLDYSGI